MTILLNGGRTTLTTMKGDLVVLEYNPPSQYFSLMSEDIVAQWTLDNVGVSIKKYDDRSRLEILCPADCMHFFYFPNDEHKSLAEFFLGLGFGNCLI